ncbi:MAG: HDOD domain-containing protein [Desulfobacteraceae bacterium]|nr:HDOD domain-containing protein [Desulfobacteraceae bacterium]
MVEKELDKVLREQTLDHLGFSPDVPGFNVSIAAFSCIYLIRSREKEIACSEGCALERYTSETLYDELSDIGVVDGDFDEILCQIKAEEYISVDDEDRYYSGKLSNILVSVLSLVYPTMKGLLLVAYFTQTAEEVKSFRKTLEEAIRQVENILAKQGVGLSLNEISDGDRLGLKKIAFHLRETVQEVQSGSASFRAIFKERAIKRDKTIDHIAKSMKEKGELPVLPLNGKYLKQQMSRSLYATADISDIIISDVAMTVNLLKMVNQKTKGRSVATVSHAIMLIGHEVMKKRVDEFVTLDDVDDDGLRKELEYIFVSSYMSNSIARNYAIKADVKDTEELCISSMIHNMGQMLVLYYYPEAYHEIKNMIGKDCSKRKAARNVIGTTYDNIGIHFARQWNFPFITVESLRVCYFNRIGTTKDNLVVNLPFCSAELCAFTGGVLDRKQTVRLRGLINSLNMFSRDLSVLLERAWADVQSFSKKQKIPISKRDLSEIAAAG